MSESLSVVGERLRLLRRREGLTGQELAELAGMSQPKISKLETARQLPTDEDLQAIASALHLPSREVDFLQEEVRRLRGFFTPWHHSGPTALARQQSAEGERERGAKAIDVLVTTVLPGLLQTPDYARAIFQLADPDADIPSAVRARMDRQTVLYDAAKSFQFLLFEAVLRARYTDVDTMRGQLAHIRTIATTSNVEVLVVGFGSRLTALAPTNMVIYDGVVVHVEHAEGSLDIYEPEKVRRYTETFSRLATIADVVTAEHGPLDDAIAGLR